MRVARILDEPDPYGCSHPVPPGTLLTIKGRNEKNSYIINHNYKSIWTMETSNRSNNN